MCRRAREAPGNEAADEGLCRKWKVKNVVARLCFMGVIDIR